jgi:hypothetical protein
MNQALLTALRDLTLRSPVVSYPVRLAFVREWTVGIHKGGVHADSIGFCEPLDAEEWVASVNRSHSAGRLEYKIVSWRVFQ